MKPVFNERNLGISASRVKALETVKGDYVTFLDGDDLFHPLKLEGEAGRIKETGATIAYSDHQTINLDGDVLSTWTKGIDMPQGNVFKEVFMRRFPENRLFRSELVNYQYWKSVGFHDTNINLYEDYDMRIRITKSAQVAYHPYIGSSYRVNPKGLSKTGLEKHITAIQYIFQKNLPLANDLPAEDQVQLKNFCSRYLKNLYRQEFNVQKSRRNIPKALRNWIHWKML